MEHTISATELARSLGDVLARVRYLSDSYVVERNGEPVARVVPLASGSPATALEAFRAWREAGAADPSFAADLERVSGLDRSPDNPWAS